MSQGLPNVEQNPPGSAYPQLGFRWLGGEGPEALTAFILNKIPGGSGTPSIANARVEN